MNSYRIRPAMRTLAILTISLLRCFLALFRNREEQAIVELALRQQLAVYVQKRSRPPLTPLDRAFWVVLSRIWPRWKDDLVVVRPETEPSASAKIVGTPRVGGLHHRYAWRKAA